MPARWPATWRATFLATPASLCRTCLALAVSRQRISSIRSRPRTAPRSAASRAARRLIHSSADMQTKPFIIGSTGAGADADVFPTVLRKMFKLPMKTVAGYGSAAEIVIAIKRAEVDGRCGWSWSSLVSWNRDMWESKQLDVVLQLAAQKLDELPDVPLVTEVTKDADQQTALKLIMSRQTMARPYVAPPGVPTERLAA